MLCGGTCLSKRSIFFTSVNESFEASTLFETLSALRCFSAERRLSFLSLPRSFSLFARMVSRKASAPKRAAATQKLSKKAATATEKAKAKKATTAKTSKSKTNAVVTASSKKQEAPASRADASALATTSGAADKHSDRGKVIYVG